MNRYFIHLSYLGTNYHGWQVQDNAQTVQGVLNDALSLLLKEPIQTIGAGRTDAGVHARHYVAHFDSHQDSLSTNAQLLRSLNHVLPADISAQRIMAVNASTNARFDATLRGYEYIICRSKNPFMQNLAWTYTAAIDADAMERAAQQLLQHTDFTSFSKLGSDNTTNLCAVSYASWRTEADLLIFGIKANRFLRNMVRAIVGTLVDVGRGRLTPDDFEKIIVAKNRGLAGTSAPAQGLYLTQIEYPQEVYITE